MRDLLSGTADHQLFPYDNEPRRWGGPSVNGKLNCRGLEIYGEIERAMDARTRIAREFVAECGPVLLEVGVWNTELLQEWVELARESLAVSLPHGYEDAAGMAGVAPGM